MIPFDFSVRRSLHFQVIMTAQPVHVFHGYLGHWYAKDGSHRGLDGFGVPGVDRALGEQKPSEPEPISYPNQRAQIQDLANIPPIRMTSVIPQRIVQPPWAFGWGWKPAQAIRARCSSAKCVPCP